MVTRTVAQVAAADAFWEAVGGQPLLDWLAVRSGLFVENEDAPDPDIRAEGSASGRALRTVSDSA
jgi:hypothetical protein